MKMQNQYAYSDGWDDGVQEGWKLAIQHVRSEALRNGKRISVKEIDAIDAGWNEANFTMEGITND